jgi:hypothetical protein
MEKLRQNYLFGTQRRQSYQCGDADHNGGSARVLADLLHHSA